MEITTPQTITLLVFCGVLAGIFMIWASPLFRSKRKEETNLEHFQRTMIDEARAEKRFQLKLNTAPEIAFKMRLTNVAGCIAILLAARYVGPWFELFLISYVAFGVFINARLRVIPIEKFQGLRFERRMEIRIFNAWLFPLHIINIVRRRRDNV